MSGRLSKVTGEFTKLLSSTFRQNGDYGIPCLTGNPSAQDATQRLNKAPKGFPHLLGGSGHFVSRVITSIRHNGISTSTYIPR